MPLRPCSSGIPVVLLSMIAGLLLIAGCTGGQSGRPAEAANRAPATAASFLGDPRTVDPCSLTDPAALARFGAARNAGTVSLDYCLLRVQQPDGGVVQLQVGELGPAEQQPGDPVTREGDLQVVRSAPLPGHCSRQIVFPDRVAMQVSADLLSGAPGGQLCGPADAGTDTALRAIREHRVAHRSYPPNSLALADPCAALDTARVRQVPGLEQAVPTGRPGGHQCQWGAQSAQAPRVRLMHTAGEPPKVLHGSAVAEDVAGRRTVTSVVGGDPRVPLCTAETGHLPFGDPGSGQVEVAMLMVAFPAGDGTDACEFARGLAEVTWPNLPRS